MITNNSNRLAAGECQIDKDGKAILPKEIIDLLTPLFGTESSIIMDISLMPDGTIQLTPTKSIDITSYLENHPEIFESAARAIIDSKEGRYVSSEEIDKLFNR